MIPTIWPGDVLTIQKSDPRDLSPEDIIVFRRGSRLFAHRILTATVNGSLVRFETRGDALAAPDPPIAAEDVLGRVDCIERGFFRLDPRAPAPHAWRLALAVLDGIRGLRRLVSGFRQRGAALRAFEGR
jgi:hypothetical protein